MAFTRRSCAACVLCCGYSCAAVAGDSLGHTSHNSTAPPVRRPVLLDCDPGLDDAFALLWLCASAARFELVGATVIPGNVGPRRLWANLAGLMQWFDCGSIRTGIGGRDAEHEGDGFHGEDGLMGLASDLPEARGEAAFSAAEVISDAIATYGQDLTIVAVGPLTNLAEVERQRPGTLRQAGELLIFGGGIELGNARPYAEFNFWYDAPAARTIFRSTRHAVFFPLNVANPVCLEEKHIELVGASSGGRRAAWLRRILVAGVKQALKYGNPCLNLYDATPVGFLLNPHMFRLARVQLDIDVDAEEGKSFYRSDGMPNSWQAVSLESGFYDMFAQDVASYVQRLAAAEAGSLEL